MLFENCSNHLHLSDLLCYVILNNFSIFYVFFPQEFIGRLIARIYPQCPLLALDDNLLSRDPKVVSILLSFYKLLHK